MCKPVANLPGGESTAFVLTAAQAIAATDGEIAEQHPDTVLLGEARQTPAENPVPLSWRLDPAKVEQAAKALSADPPEATTNSPLELDLTSEQTPALINSKVQDARITFTYHHAWLGERQEQVHFVLTQQYLEALASLWMGFKLFKYRSSDGYLLVFTNWKNTQRWSPHDVIDSGMNAAVSVFGADYRADLEFFQGGYIRRGPKNPQGQWTYELFWPDFSAQTLRRPVPELVAAFRSLGIEVAIEMKDPAARHPLR